MKRGRGTEEEGEREEREDILLADHPHAGHCEGMVWYRGEPSIIPPQQSI